MCLVCLMMYVIVVLGDAWWCLNVCFAVLVYVLWSVSVQYCVLICMFVVAASACSLLMCVLKCSCALFVLLGEWQVSPRKGRIRRLRQKTRERDVFANAQTAEEVGSVGSKIELRRPARENSAVKIAKGPFSGPRVFHEKSDSHDYLSNRAFQTQVF